MSTDNRVIYWIGHAPEKKATEAFRSALRKLGLRSEWVVPGDEASLRTPDWSEKHLPEPVAAVVWTDPKPAVLAKWLVYFRGENLPKVPSSPVVAGFDSDRREGLAECAAIGVDDVFFFGEDPDAFAHRVFVRIKGTRERDELRQQLRDLQVRSARNETIVKQREEFLSVAAHDLRSPLGLIQASLGMVIDQKNGLSPVHQELLVRARRQAGQALSLVNDLLDVMCFEQGLKPDYRILNLHELLSEFYQDYRMQAEQKQVHFHYQNSIQDWKVLADSDRIRQLVQNLFVNALKYTDPGKNIYLTVEPFTGRRKNDPPYPMVVISVKDEGRGIPPRELQRIFDRFAQLRDSSRSEGRGLGLTVAKQISSLHDGNIWVHSQEGKGSVFHVLFPHVISRTNLENQDAGKRILVVEPSKDRREIQFRSLQDWGYDVQFVKDGVTAVAMAFYEPPGLILLGSDTGMMPEGEVVNTLKGEKEIASVPVLKLVAPGTSLQKRDDSLVDGYLEIPLSRAAFENILVQVGRGHLVKPKAAA